MYSLVTKEIHLLPHQHSVHSREATIFVGNFVHAQMQKGPWMALCTDYIIQLTWE